MELVVNAAMSADGKLSSRRREQIRISGAADFDRVDRIRAESDGVMVGVGTVLADDPSLTLDSTARIEARTARGDPPHPARVVVDSTLRTPHDAQILSDTAETYILTTTAASAERASQLQTAGATVIQVDSDGTQSRVEPDDTAGATERVALADGVAALESHGIERLMVEGGGELIFSLVAAELVDHLSVFVGSLIIGGREAPTLADGEGFTDGFPSLELVDVTPLDDGVVLEYDLD